jgi:hypothetical protein
MDDTIDSVNGRSKEATEVLSAEESPKNEGKLDQLIRQLKEKAAKATKKMRKVLTGKPLPQRTKWRA